MNSPAIGNVLCFATAIALLACGGCGLTFSPAGQTPAVKAPPRKAVATRAEQLTEQMQTAFLYSFRMSRTGDRIPPPTFTWTFGADSFEVRASDTPLPEELTQLVTGHHLSGGQGIKNARFVTGQWRIESNHGNDVLILSEVKIDGRHFTGVCARLSIYTYNTGWVYAYGNSPSETTFSVEPLPGEGPPRAAGAGPQSVELQDW